MRDHDTSGSAEKAPLSTEDIARSPRDAGQARDGGGGRDGQGSAAPPVYPGESTEIPTNTSSPDDRERGGDADTEREEGYRDETPPADTQADESRAPTEGAPRAAAPPADAARAEGATAADGDGTEDAPELLSSEDEKSFRTRWHEVQNLFVDDPREAVHAADALVADVMQTLAATFAEHKENLEGQWNRGESVDTESLRIALRQYRSFFNRLLTT
ncbi:hypothetical protein OG361_00720 [Streptomyces sp. NBC_00090]|uniref:hypothetical protein n=1 Tax=Streptomyces sp. NBC_00090 TaxID=2903619 RepID=UPI0032558A5F